uniref:Adenylate kinase isoenzyme 1 n=1 Tax=Coccidioides posadasii RMSCC 3488 TaxID=454284 RepID=A0A0J6FP95_COCPO|nr:adenylate kinase isoenzyme 1 [Coccidioides posadasii RMSCC 3488]
MGLLKAAVVGHVEAGQMNILVDNFPRDMEQAAAFEAQVDCERGIDELYPSIKQLVEVWAELVFYTIVYLTASENLLLPGHTTLKR